MNASDGLVDALGHRPIAVGEGVRGITRAGILPGAAAGEAAVQRLAARQRELEVLDPGRRPVEDRCLDLGRGAHPADPVGVGIAVHGHPGVLEPGHRAPALRVEVGLECLARGVAELVGRDHLEVVDAAAEHRRVGLVVELEPGAPQLGGAVARELLVSDLGAVDLDLDRLDAGAGQRPLALRGRRRGAVGSVDVELDAVV